MTASDLLGVIDPPIERNRAVVDLALFFIGAGLCFCFLLSDPRQPHLWIFTALVTLVRACSGLGRATATRRSPGRACARAAMVAITAFWLYAAITFGLMLAWASPAWVCLVTPALVVAAAVTARRPVAGARVPLALGLGVWILMCLLGWRNQDGMLRCVDLRRVVAQRGVSVIVPTFPVDLPRRCGDGETFVVGRYPRHIWEAPDGRRLVVTTQFYSNHVHHGEALPPRLTGSICDTRLDGAAPRCFGDGTAQAIHESVRDDRLYVAAYSQHVPGQRGVIYAVSRSDPMRILAERRFRDDTGEFYLDSAADLLGVASDQAADLMMVRASDLTPGEPVAARFQPGDTQYDQHRGEGIFCGSSGPIFLDHGRGYAAVAFTGAPFRYRLLASTPRYPSSWLSLTWGCDWDPVGRRAFVANANFGWLGTIDFDGGHYLSRHFVGLGVRSVAWDARRRVVYLADFLRGDVFAVDPESGRETMRWYAGRFLRQVIITRDGNALLVSSNAGVVRIELAGG